METGETSKTIRRSASVTLDRVSGTDHLARTLGIMASREDAYSRIRGEVTEKSATGLMTMEYLEACQLETCRLFPPVTRTVHFVPYADTFDGFRIPAGMEILHFLTAGERDTSVDATANEFRPERRLEPGGNASATYPNLFLGRAQNCPGKDLMLLVCKAAISTLMKTEGIAPRLLSQLQTPMGFDPGYVETWLVPRLPV